MQTATLPRVSIGVPVRNGAETLQHALKSVLEQDYPNLEILISDNASSDATPRLCQELAARDSRIRYIRQPDGRSGWENFRFVFEQTDGPYFLWAAADDMRESNYVSTLVQALEKNPNAAIAFSALSWFSDHRAPIAFQRRDYSCDTRNLDLQAALRTLYERHFSYEIYGLIRRSALVGYSWDDTDNGADFLTLVWLLARGPVAQVPGTCFHYFRDLSRQNAKSRAQSFAYGALRPMPDLRLAWHSARILAQAAAEESGLHKRLCWTFRFYWYWKRGFRPWLHELQHSSLAQILRRGYYSLIRR